MFRSWFALSPILLTTALFAAQPSKTSAPTFLETLEVRITNVDVVVTDRAGNPVRGLHPEDFEVREHGALQPITNFAEYGEGGGETLTKVNAANQPEAAAPPPRRFIFFIDDMNLHPDARTKLLRGAQEIVERQMRPGDEAMIVTPATQQKLAAGFTADKALLAAKIDQVLYEQTRFRADSRQVREKVFAQSEFRPRAATSVSSPRYPYTPATFYGNMVHRRVSSTLRTLFGVVGTLSQTSGKKVLVVMTDSLPWLPGNETWEDLLDPPRFDSPSAFVGNDPRFDLRPMLDEIAARANANGVTIYSIQPALGVELSPPGLGADNGFHRGLIVSAGDRRAIEETKDSLGALADKTGGKSFFAEPSIEEGFRTIERDLGSYYSLAYRAPSEGNDTIRDVVVKVKGRDDLQVRTRRDILRRSPQAEMDEVVAASLVAPIEANELGIQATASRPKQSRGTMRFDVTVTIPMEKLTFVPQDGKYHAAFTVHYAASDARDYSTGEMREQVVDIPAAEVDAARAKAYTYTSTLVVAPGTANVAVGVFDKYSGLSGFQRLDVKAR